MRLLANRAPVLPLVVQDDDVLGGCVDAARDVFQEIVEVAVLVLLVARGFDVLWHGVTLFRTPSLITHKLFTVERE